MNRFFHWYQMADAPMPYTAPASATGISACVPTREALADHHPRAEPAAAEKVLAAAPHAIARDEPDAGDGDEVSDEDRPVEPRDRHAVTLQMRRSHVSGSQSAVTLPAVVMPR